MLVQGTPGQHRPTHAGAFSDCGKYSSSRTAVTRKFRSRKLIKIRELKWCGEGDLNPHEIAPASTSSRKCVFCRVSWGPKQLICQWQLYPRVSWFFQRWLHFGLHHPPLSQALATVLQKLAIRSLNPIGVRSRLP